MYNGKAKLKDKRLKLSDAFHINDGKTSLELTVDIIDVNYDSGHEVLEKSASLQSYAYLIDQINKNIGQGLKRDKSISLAIDHCIEQGILVEFLKTNYEEVAKMLNWQYDEEAEHRAIRQEEHEKGRLQERIEMAKKMLSDNMPLETISQYTELAVGMLKNLKEKL